MRIVYANKVKYMSIVCIYAFKWSEGPGIRQQSLQKKNL